MSKFHPATCPYPPIPLKSASPATIADNCNSCFGSSLLSRIVLKRPNADKQVERAAAIAN